MMSDPNTSERTIKTLAGWIPIRVQISESVLCELPSDAVAVVWIRESRTDAASVRTSTRRIQRPANWKLSPAPLERIKAVNVPDWMRRGLQQGCVKLARSTWRYMYQY